MYSTHNEGKSVIVERFIRTLKNKIYKHITSISKNLHIDKLADVVNKYNNTYHSTIKNQTTCINPSSKINDKYPKFKVGDYVRISQYKNIFPKDYVPNWSEEVCVIKKVQNTVPWRYVISDLTEKKLLELFAKKNCKKQIKKSLESKK